ncbi:hypothetical protein, partial [Pseudomonas syringae]|uniref:hypothetical protein n=1 Tax=Pseudomonas syringae TaxID=317 RepID=UPI0034D68084
DLEIQAILENRQGQKARELNAHPNPPQPSHQKLKSPHTPTIEFKNNLKQFKNNQRSKARRN